MISVSPITLTEFTATNNIDGTLICNLQSPSFGMKYACICLWTLTVLQSEQFSIQGTDTAQGQNVCVYFLKQNEGYLLTYCVYYYSNIFTQALAC